MSDEIGGELVVSVGKNAGEGGVDGAELGSFEIGIGVVDGGAEIGGADVELLGEVGGFAVEIAKESAKGHDEKEQHDAASGDFDDGEFARRVGGFGWAGGLRDLIKIGKVIHKHIIAYIL